MRKLCFLLLLLFIFIIGNTQTVWNGPTITFSKAENVATTSAAGQDRITNNVWLTRDVAEGIYNIASEGSYTKRGTSPAGTEWAYGDLSNYSTLTYKTWEGWNGKKPPTMIDKKAVLHLTAENIYIGITFTGWGGGGSGTFSYTRTTASALPVNLKSFTATLNANNATLNWTTAGEINNKYFDVEHSYEGNTFTSLGKVEGVGTSASDKSYSFTHYKIAGGKHYYRLAQYDIDGAVKYSQVVSLISKSNEGLRITPNPATAFFTISSSFNLSGSSYSVNSVSGQTVQKGIANHGQIGVEKLPPGQYWIIVRTTSEEVLKAQFLKR